MCERAVRALIKERPVHLHEELDDVASKAMHRGVPMLPAVLVESAEDEWEDFGALLHDE